MRILSTKSMLGSCGGKRQGISALSRESRTKEGMGLDQGTFADYEMSPCPHITTPEKLHSLQAQAIRKAVRNRAATCCDVEVHHWMQLEP